jgi:hypothetical protein
MNNLAYTLRMLCQRNRDGSHARQADRLRTLTLASRQLREAGFSFVLCSLALLGVLTAFFWKLVGPPHFPFFLVLGISLGFEFALVLYHAFLRLLGTNW